MELLLAATEPTDFWRDSIWQSWGVIVGAILAIAGMILTIWIFRKGIQKKEIAYSVVSDVYLLNVNKSIKDEVEIRFKGMVTENLRVLVIKIWNSGNAAVERDDYDEEISFKFGKKSAIEADIVDESPEDINANIVLYGSTNFRGLASSSVTIDKLLLNPKESITIKVLLTGKIEKITASARIVNGKLVNKSYDGSSGRISLLSYIFFGTIAGALYLIKDIFPVTRGILDKVFEDTIYASAGIGFFVFIEVVAQWLARLRRR